MPGSKAHLAVQMHFKYTILDGAKTERAECQRCSHYSKARNTTREEQHLQECRGYQTWLDAQKEIGIGSTIKRQRVLDDTMVIRIPVERKARIDQDLALCIFKTGKPLSLFDDDCWNQFFKKHFGYTLPTRNTIAGPLLDQSYEAVKNTVATKLSASSFLNIVTDESTDISKNRIINTSVVTNSGDSFFWSNIEADEGKMGADELAAHAIEATKDITNGQLSKVTSITTDTCSTMRALWSRLEKNQDMQHVFAVPCDSHGLQLIFKDLLERPIIKQFWTTASAIVNGFRNAPKQYAYLRQEQKKAYGQRKALTASVITRWGTQYSLLKSLNDSKAALREYADRNDIEFAFKHQLQRGDFWFWISELLDLFEPIHRVQTMSEANRANISYVYQRWAEVELHLKKIANSNSLYATDVKVYFNTVFTNSVKLEGIDKKNWTRRCEKQLLDLHIAAYFLHPDKYKAELTLDQQKRLVKVFKRYTSDHKTTLEQFYDFRSQQGSFGLDGQAWEYIEKPALFWRYMETACPILSTFARRLLTSIANSVPSERAFSNMSYIHSKIRNSLSVDRANKLQFIHMNSRVLSKRYDPELAEQKLLEWEDEYGVLAGQE